MAEEMPSPSSCSLKKSLETGLEVVGARSELFSSNFEAFLADARVGSTLYRAYEVAGNDEPGEIQRIRSQVLLTMLSSMHQWSTRCVRRSSDGVTPIQEPVFVMRTSDEVDS